MPGVSRNTICAPGIVSTPWIEVRVVCGLSATIATFCPTRALSSVDFPTLGRPINETNPDRNGSLMRHRLGFTDANLLHAPLIGGQYLHANAVAVHQLAGLRHPPQPLADQAAHGGRFDVLLAVERIEQVGHAVQIEIAGHDETAMAV